MAGSATVMADGSMIADSAVQTSLCSRADDADGLNPNSASKTP
jgi:hypothetical protein